jgi:hypothetical protein
MYLQKARDVTYETIITENFSKLMKLREHKGELISLSLSLSLSHTHTHTHTHTHICCHEVGSFALKAMELTDHGLKSRNKISPFLFNLIFCHSDGKLSNMIKTKHLKN